LLRLCGPQTWRRLAEIGEEQFRAWVPAATGFVADEALLLIEAARVTDAGGDVAALLARDDVPKVLHLPPDLAPAASSAPIQAF
jgi:hypothetical protein